MRSIHEYGAIRFLNARVTPDGRLAIAIAAQSGPGDIHVFMGLMRIEEFGHEVTMPSFTRRSSYLRDDWLARFTMAGTLDAFAMTTLDEYAEEAWRRRYDDREPGPGIEAARPMLEDGRDG